MRSVLSLSVIWNLLILLMFYSHVVWFQFHLKQPSPHLQHFMNAYYFVQELDHAYFCTVNCFNILLNSDCFQNEAFNNYGVREIQATG